MCTNNKIVNNYNMSDYSSDYSLNPKENYFFERRSHSPALGEARDAPTTQHKILV